MSRIFQDQDAKAMILVIALLIGIPVLASLAAPKHAAPEVVATSSSEH